MIRVLQILVAVNDGGIEKLIYEYYKRMDHSKVHFDFAVNDNRYGYLQKPLEEMGCKIYQYTKFRVNYYQGIKDLKRIINEGNYDIVHSHLGNRSFQIIRYAKRNGVPITISHSHSAFQNERIHQHLFRKISSYIASKYSDYLFACGTDAGEWMWGKRHFQVLTNAIDTGSFKYDYSVRKKYRTSLKIDDKYVLICVGRLSHQKNQVRLVDIFNNYHKMDPNSVLLMIGEGDKKEEIIKKAKEYNLEDSIYMLGVRDDVSQLLSASDCFILPSHFEGLPISVIEAQCSGLPCLLSDSITGEVAITDIVSYMSLTELDKEWGNRIELCKNKQTSINRNEYWEIVEDCGYGIIKAANTLQDFYLGVTKKR